MILGAKYLKASECKLGDLIKFLDEGKWVESTKFTYEDGKPKQQLVFEVEDGSGDKKSLTLNKTNRDALVEAWGKDTSLWVGKIAEITIKTIEVAGREREVIRLKAQE
jgi:hypothetical protein